MAQAKPRELQGLPGGPGTLSACRAQKASHGSWHLSWTPEDGTKPTRERREGTVFQVESPACAKAGAGWGRWGRGQRDRAR